MNEITDGRDIDRAPTPVIDLKSAPQNGEVFEKDATANIEMARETQAQARLDADLTRQFDLDRKNNPNDENLRSAAENQWNKMLIGAERDPTNYIGSLTQHDPDMADRLEERFRENFDEKTGKDNVRAHETAPDQAADYYKVMVKGDDGRISVLAENTTAEQAKTLSDRLATINKLALESPEVVGPATHVTAALNGEPARVARFAADRSIANAKPVVPQEETIARNKRDLEALSGAGQPEQVATGEPRIEVPGSDYLREHINRQRELSDNLGVTADIERLSYEGKTVQQVSNDLDAKLKRVDEIAAANGENAAVEKRELVRAVRASLGIPSMDDKTEFDEWKKGYEARTDRAARDDNAKLVDAPALRKDAGSGQEPGESSASKRVDDKEKDDKEFVTPETLRKRYIEADNKFYFRDEENKLAFEDTGKRLATDHNDPQVARSMVELAEAKKWNTIKVRGADEFKREVWLQASMRGMQVQGYKPNDVDLAKLAEQRKERSPLNTIEESSRERQPARESSARGDRARQSEGKTAPSTAAPHAAAKDWAAKAVGDTTEKTGSKEATDKIVIDEQKRGLSDKQQTAIDTLKEVMRARGDSEKAVDMASKVAAENFHNNRVYAGKVVEHGAAPYENDPKNDKSYYVKLDTPSGEKVVWGVDLKRAVDESKAEKGDVVAIAYQGKKEVTVPVKEMDANGKPTGQTVDTVADRITWDVSKLDKLRDEARERLTSAARNTDRQQPVISVYDRAAPRNAEREVAVRDKAKDRQPEHAGRG